MSKLQGFKCIHVCKCDKSVKRRTVKQFYLFLSNEMIKLDFITQHWQHTIVTQMNLYDNTSIILIALILNKDELDFDHPACLSSSVTLKKNKLNINNMLTLLFYFPYNLLLLDTYFINVDKYKHTNESKTNEQNMHS